MTAGNDLYTETVRTTDAKEVRDRVPGPPAPPSPDADIVVRLRSGVMRLGRRLRRTEAAASLAPSAADVLGSVVRIGPVGLTALAETENLNPTMLSRLVAKLEDTALVARIPDPADGRAAFVDATAKGRALHAEIQRERTEALRSAVSALSEKDQAVLEEFLPVLERLVELTRMRMP